MSASDSASYVTSQSHPGHVTTHSSYATLAPCPSQHETPPPWRSAPWYQMWRQMSLLQASPLLPFRRLDTRPPLDRLARMLAPYRYQVALGVLVALLVLLLVSWLTSSDLFFRVLQSVFCLLSNTC